MPVSGAGSGELEPDAVTMTLLENHPEKNIICAQPWQNVFFKDLSKANRVELNSQEFQQSYRRALAQRGSLGKGNNCFTSDQPLLLRCHLAGLRHSPPTICKGSGRSC